MTPYFLDINGGTHGCSQLILNDMLQIPVQIFLLPGYCVPQ